MTRERTWIVGSLLAAVLALPGCLFREKDWTFDEDCVRLEMAATQIEYPDLAAPCDDQIAETPAPRDISETGEIDYWDVTLEEAVHLALLNSTVFRDLGGTVLRAPATVRTGFAPAIQETDPQFGVQAALSEFDTEFSTSLFYEVNDRRLNNQFLGSLGVFEQKFGVFQAQLAKRSATGSQFVLRKNVEFDDDNAPGNEFDSGWQVNMEGEFRHPLLQGAGLPFNRIAGPGGVPGSIQGVVIARIKTDVSLADFELAVRDLVSNVENTYWDLYFAYRDLDAKVKARDTALETWRRVHALWKAGRRGGEDDKEAQAREQYFLFKLDVQNALSGRLLEGTRTNNGSSAGTFRGTGGVQVTERRLRLLLGLPASDDRLIRPADEPGVAPVRFPWGDLVSETLIRRPELRRQRWQVKRREMELLASKNFLLPNLDLVGRYRWRGFGENLIESSRNGRPRFDNAYRDLTTGDFQEWQFGVEFSLPIGFRQEHAAVRNAELNLARECAVLDEQERQVVHDVSNAMAEVNRAYETMQTSYNRLVAAKNQMDVLWKLYLGDKAEFFVVLDSQRRFSGAQSLYYQSQVEYALAVKNLHFEKGSLLDYCSVFLSEGPWPGKAYLDAARRERLRGHSMRIRSTRINPPIVSQGPVPQDAAYMSQQPIDAPNDPFADDSEGAVEALPNVPTVVASADPGADVVVPADAVSGDVHSTNAVKPMLPASYTADLRDAPKPSSPTSERGKSRDVIRLLPFVPTVSRSSDSVRPRSPATDRLVPPIRSTSLFSQPPRAKRDEQPQSFQSRSSSRRRMAPAAQASAAAPGSVERVDATAGKSDSQVRFLGNQRHSDRMEESPRHDDGPPSASGAWRERTTLRSSVEEKPRSMLRMRTIEQSDNQSSPAGLPRATADRDGEPAAVQTSYLEPVDTGGFSPRRETHLSPTRGHTLQQGWFGRPPSSQGAIRRLPSTGPED